MFFSQNEGNIMQLDLMLDSPGKVDNLFQRFEEIHNFIYANDGLSSQQTLDEITKILFIKIFDETRGLNKFFVASNELDSVRKHHKAEELFLRLDLLFSKTQEEYFGIFDSDDKLRLSINSLAFIVDKLQNISLTSSTNDAKGLAFQKFLVSQEKGARGQFFTPAPVIEFCVKFIDPKSNESIIDPACGTGAFLFSSLRHILKNNPELCADVVINKNIYGIDINKSVARIAKMKFLLESNTKVNVACANSLENISELGRIIKTLNKNQVAESGFDVVLTNPPFGTQGKITSSKILSMFDLGHKWINEKDGFTPTQGLLQGQAAEILFIERCLTLLREGGRLGIVLPNGHFENSSLNYLRYFIKQKARILGVVNLPSETFVPFGTGVKTSLLFLQKDTSTNKRYKVFFGKVSKLGYQGNKNALPVYKKNQYGENIRDSKGDFILEEDFSSILGDYSNYKRGCNFKSDQSYVIDSKDINGRFDYDYYSPENKRLISSLRNKDSVRLGEIVQVVRAKSKKLLQSDMPVCYVELSDINTHSFEIINSASYLVHELPSRASYEIQKGDILTAVAGNSIGTSKHATALVSEEYSGCICTNGLRVLRDPKIDPFYLIFYLRSKAFLKQVFMYRTGAAIPSISDTDLENVLIFLPNKEEIDEISKKVKNAFELRDKSRKQFEAIDSLIEDGKM